MQVRLSCTVMLTLDRADVNHLEEASLFHERWVTLGMDLQLMPVCALRPQAARLAQPHLAQQQRQLQPSDGLHPAPRPHPPLPPPKRLLRPVIGRRSPPIPKCNPIAQPALGYPQQELLEPVLRALLPHPRMEAGGKTPGEFQQLLPPIGGRARGTTATRSRSGRNARSSSGRNGRSARPTCRWRGKAPWRWG